MRFHPASKAASGSLSDPLLSQASLSRRMTWVVNSVCALFLALTLALLWQQWNAYTHARNAMTGFRIFHATLVAMEKVSVERGPSNSVLGENLPIAAERLSALRQARVRSDDALRTLEERLGSTSSACSWCAEELDTVDGARKDLLAARRKVDELMALPLTQRNSPEVGEIVNNMVSVIPQFTPLLYESTMEVIKSDASALDPMQMARLAAMLREQAGLLGSRFTAALGRSRPLTYTEQLAIEQSYGRVDQLRLLIDAEATYGPLLSQKNLPRMRKEYFGDGLAYIATVRRHLESGKDTPSTAMFADRYVPLMQPIVDFRDEMLAQAEDEVHRHQSAALDRFFRTAAAGGLLVMVLLLVANAFRRQVMQPFTEAAGAIGAIANGNFPEQLQSQPYQGEIQSLFDAVGVLKENSLARVRLEEERRRLIAELQAMAETDALTHLMNRRAFEKHARTLRALPDGEDSFIALIMFDIDHFKKINDTYGHASGDAALKVLAEVCREIWRKQDIVARIGGEEFAVLMETRDPHDALQATQRFREKLAQTPVACEQGTRFFMTASFGIALTKRSQLPELSVLLKRADRLLYKAKDNGRNRVETEDAEFPVTS